MAHPSLMRLRLQKVHGIVNNIMTVKCDCSFGSVYSIQYTQSSKQFIRPFSHRQSFD